MYSIQRYLGAHGPMYKALKDYYDGRNRGWQYPRSNALEILRNTAYGGEDDLNLRQIAIDILMPLPMQVLFRLTGASRENIAELCKLHPTTQFVVLDLA